jgi:hypothetical protein
MTSALCLLFKSIQARVFKRGPVCGGNKDSAVNLLRRSDAMGYSFINPT